MSDRTEPLHTTYSEITRANARLLADAAGGFVHFAEKTGMAEAQVSHLIGKNPVRNIGSKLARKIEAAFEKPIGWLDRPHNDTPSDVASDHARVQLLTAELDAIRDRVAKASACLRASRTSDETDNTHLVSVALDLLEEM